MSISTNRKTYTFNMLDKNSGISKLLTHVDINRHVCPYELTQPKTELIKGLAYPLVQETYEAIKNNTVIPILLKDTIKELPKPDQSAISMIPPYFFDFTRPAGNNKFVCAVNMDLKGGYKRTKGASGLGQVQSLNIDERSFFHYCSLGYVVSKLFEYDSKGILATADDFCRQMASFYAILMGKCLDKNFNMIDEEALDILYILCGAFALEGLMGVSKKNAVNLAKKMKFIRRENRLLNVVPYLIDDNISFMNGVDYVKRFPIDNFCDVLAKTFSNFRSSRFNPPLLVMYFTNLYGLNSFFVPESFIALVTLYMFSRAKMFLFSDNVINKNMEIIKTELNKTFNLFLSKR